MLMLNMDAGMRPNPTQKILFAPASGDGIGGGHVMRCLTLAQALSARGAVCEFVVGHDGAQLLKAYGAGRFVLHCYVGEKTEPAIAAVVHNQHFDSIVIDDYLIADNVERRLAKHTRRVVVIDDLADRAHCADLLVDPGFGRSAQDYNALLPDAAVRLIGPAFAMVRPAFGALRGATLGRSATRKPNRIFMSFGLSDVEAIAGRAVDLVTTSGLDLQIDVALSSSAQSAPRLRALAAADDRVRLHFDARDVADLMASADMAIGAGGASTWERCTLGLPTLAVIVADNQRPMIHAMAADGALLAVDLTAATFEADFTAALQTLAEVDVRIALRDRSAALCDGQGANRIADAILAL